MKCDFSRLGCALSVGLALFGLGGRAAHAQEVIPRWHNPVFANDGYPTERAAQIAIENWFISSFKPEDPIEWEVRSQAFTREASVHLYGIRPAPLSKSNWTYSYMDIYYPSQEALLTAMRTGNQSYCPVATPEPVWVRENGVGNRPENSTDESWRKGVTVSWRNLDGSCRAPVASIVDRSRTVQCPNRTMMKWKDDLGACFLSDSYDGNSRRVMTYQTAQVPKLCHGVGNPCDPTTGDKFQVEADIDLGWVRLDRYYHSLTSTFGSPFGANWTHSHNISLAIGLNTSSSPDNVGLIDFDGSHVYFQKGQGYYEASDGSGDRAVRNASGWVLNRPSEVIKFGITGLPQVREYEDGTWLKYSHDALGRLLALTHSTGRELRFAYREGTDRRVASISVNGVVYASYDYASNGQLASVSYAGSGLRKYHYEDARFPSHLTGVTTEDGARYSWFAYDEKGRVVCSRHDEGCI